MKMYVTEFDFKNALIDHYSYKAVIALFDYFENYENDTGQELEFYPLVIRSEWSEYKSFKDFQNNYNHGIKEIKTVDDLRNYTEVIEFDGGLLVSSF